MILRVYAMWNRCKTILFTLLFIHALQIITTVIFIGLHNDPDTYFSGMSELKYFWTRLTSFYLC